jgi:hypothetical protein
VNVFPPAMPVDVAEHALAEKLAPLGAGQGAQMNVREMGEGEHGARGLRLGGLDWSD